MDSLVLTYQAQSYTATPITPTTATQTYFNDSFSYNAFAYHQASSPYLTHGSAVVRDQPQAATDWRLVLQRQQLNGTFLPETPHIATMGIYYCLVCLSYGHV